MTTKPTAPTASTGVQLVYLQQVEASFPASAGAPIITQVAAGAMASSASAQGGQRKTPYHYPRASVSTAYMKESSSEAATGTSSSSSQNARDSLHESSSLQKTAYVSPSATASAAAAAAASSHYRHSPSKAALIAEGCLSTSKKHLGRSRYSRSSSSAALTTQTAAEFSKRLDAAETALGKGTPELWATLCAELHSAEVNKAAQLLVAVARSVKGDTDAFRKQQYTVIVELIDKCVDQWELLNEKDVENVKQAVLFFKYSGFLSRLIEILAHRKEYKKMLDVLQVAYKECPSALLHAITATKAIGRLGTFYSTLNATKDERAFLQKLLTFCLESRSGAQSYEYHLKMHLLLERPLSDFLNAITWNPRTVLNLLEKFIQAEEEGSQRKALFQKAYLKFVSTYKKKIETAQFIDAFTDAQIFQRAIEKFPSFSPLKKKTTVGGKAEVVTHCHKKKKELRTDRDVAFALSAKEKQKSKVS